ncbi:MAG: NAD(+) synthase [Thermotogaceae bacterium]|nr:NAD(+) synthase [Thermotogaceae bacterium]
MRRFDPAEEAKRIKEFLKKFIEDHGFKGASIGVSGGIDSAVVLFLLKDVIDKTKIKALILPERDSSPQSVKDAKLVCKEAGIDCEIRSITPVLRKLGVYNLQPPALFAPYKAKAKYALKKWKELAGNETYIKDITLNGDEEFLKGVAYYRAKHRVRMCVLYMEAEMRGYTVVGTTNKTEWLTGFYVKWGDDATDVEPLLHLYKMEVFKLAEYLGVPKRIVEKPPTPDLVPGVTDEFALGMKYEEIDGILMAMESGEDLKKFDKEKIEHVKKLVELAKKRNLRMVSLERQ